MAIDNKFIIKYNDKSFIGVKIKGSLDKKVKEMFPRHGCPECHFCDMARSGLGFVCNDGDVADIIEDVYKGCNGFDMKNNIIFIELDKEEVDE